jgi:hypothetical protein
MLLAGTTGTFPTVGCNGFDAARTGTSRADCDRLRARAGRCISDAIAAVRANGRANGSAATRPRPRLRRHADATGCQPDSVLAPVKRLGGRQELHRERGPLARSSARRHCAREFRVDYGVPNGGGQSGSLGPSCGRHRASTEDRKTRTPVADHVIAQPRSTSRRRDVGK